MRYNDLNENEQRLCVVQFEMDHGPYQYGLINRAMERANPVVIKKQNGMFQALEEASIKTAIDTVKKEAAEMLKQVHLLLSK